MRVELFAELVGGDGEDRRSSRFSDARAVDGDVEGTELGERCVDHLLGHTVVTGRSAHADGVSTAATDLGHRLVHQLAIAGC